MGCSMTSDLNTKWFAIPEQKLINIPVKYGITRSKEMISDYFYSLTTTEYIMFDKSCMPYLRAKFALFKDKKLYCQVAIIIDINPTIEPFNNQNKDLVVAKFAVLRRR